MNDILFTPIRLSELETLVQNSVRKVLSETSKQKQEPQPETDRWFTIEELCEYLPDKPAKSTIYGYIHSMSIPFHKTTKRLRFLKSEIDTWLKSGKRQTVSEIEAEADQYLVKKKRR